MPVKRIMNLAPKMKKSTKGPSTESINSSFTSMNSSLPDQCTQEHYYAHRLAIEVAEEEKAGFREELPRSLREEVNHNHEKDCVAPFKQEELVLGPKLGSGEFSNVYEIQAFRIQQDVFSKDTSFSNNELEKRLHMKKSEKYRQTSNARYALKHIKQDYLRRNGMDEYVQTAGDLALEAEFLANLNHPNIIKLRGLTHSGAAGFANGPCGYFLIIDRLFETLDVRIKRWHNVTLNESRRSSTGSVSRSSMMAKGIRSKLKSLPSFNKTKMPNGEGIEVEMNGNELMDECLNVALQISAGVMYLHSHSIIFRDLKPANIGFDVRGDVKIFDFGLARIMPEGGSAYYDKFEMSGAGSPRYMAPETLIDEDYNMKADVYTFSIVLWEILTGKTPYSFVRSRDDLVQHVVEGGRPELDDGWPAQVKSMMKNSFDGNIHNRPKMVFFHNVIRKALTTLRGGDTTGLTHSHINRRRSVASVLQNSTLSSCMDFEPDDLLTPAGRASALGRNSRLSVRSSRGTRT